MKVGDLNFLCNFIIRHLILSVHSLKKTNYFDFMSALKSDIRQMPEFFDRYILPVPWDNVLIALEQSLEDFTSYDWEKVRLIGDQVYLPGKWTIKELLQHINDNERIQSYRALRFARKDATPLPGYDEDLFVENSTANARSLEELIEEFVLLRKSAINLYRSFNEEVFQRTGICFNKELSVLALGFVLVGHQIHHMNIIRERYFPLV